MYNPLGGGEGKGCEALADQAQAVVETEAGNEPGAQRTSIDELHRHHEIALVSKRAVNGRDVRVREAGLDLDLPQKPPCNLPIRGQIRSRRLQRFEPDGEDAPSPPNPADPACLESSSTT